MKKRYYILIAILSYLFFTLANIPAAKVVTLLESNVSIPAKFYGVYGSLWNGGAEKVLIQGQPPVDQLQWSLNPASLLLATLNADIKASIKEQNIIGNLSLSATGTFSASDIRARIDAGVMQELAQMPIGELGGVFNINIESMQLDADKLPIINADINWKNATLTLVESVDLGHVNILIKPDDDDKLAATITNKQGQLTLDGKTSVDNKKSYSVDLRITPEKNATDNIRQSLAMFSRRQTDGSYLLKRNGNLNEFGL